MNKPDKNLAERAKKWVYEAEFLPRESQAAKALDLTVIRKTFVTVDSFNAMKLAKKYKESELNIDPATGKPMYKYKTGRVVKKEPYTDPPEIDANQIHIEEATGTTPQPANAAVVGVTDQSIKADPETNREADKEYSSIGKFTKGIKSLFDKSTPNTDLEPPSNTDLEPAPNTDLEPPSNTDLEPAPNTGLEPAPNTDLEPAPNTGLERVPNTDLEPPPVVDDIDPIAEQAALINHLVSLLFPGDVLRLENIPFKVYLATEGYGSSSIKEYLHNPKKFKARKDGEIPPKTGKHFDVGTGSHSLILEPDKFHTDCIKQSEDIKVRNGKKWDEFKTLHSGKTIITPKDWDLVHKIRDRVITDQGRFFKNGISEVSYWKRDAETGLILKSRIDYEIKGTIAIDLKTDYNADPDIFYKDNKHYLQNALYTYVTGMDKFIFVIVEKEPPFDNYPAVFSEEDKARAYFLFRKAVLGIKKSIVENEWPGYSKGESVVKLSIPKWQSYEIDRQMVKEGVK